MGKGEVGSLIIVQEKMERREEREEEMEVASPADQHAAHRQAGEGSALLLHLHLSLTVQVLGCRVRPLHGGRGAGGGGGGGQGGGGQGGGGQGGGGCTLATWTSAGTLTNIWTEQVAYSRSKGRAAIRSARNQPGWQVARWQVTRWQVAGEQVDR